MTTDARNYTQQDCVQFVEDMEDLGYDVEHYRGRAYWEGPSVTVDDPAAMMRVLAATEVVCQFDSMGLGYVVYPVVSDEGEDPALTEYSVTVLERYARNYVVEAASAEEAKEKVRALADDDPGVGFEYHSTCPENDWTVFNFATEEFEG